MRWVSRHQALKAAVTAVLATIGVLSVGCDARESDQQATRQYQQGDYKAAMKGASSPVLQALAGQGAVEQDLRASLPTYRDLSRGQAQVSSTLFTLNQLASQATVVANSSSALAKLDPATVLKTIDTTAQNVKGDAAATWAPAGSEAQIATIAAANARANQLKDQIAEIDRTISGLKEKRDAAAAASARLLEQSEGLKGEASVQLYRQAVDNRAQTTSLNTQIEQAQAALVPLQQELAVTQMQAQTATQTLEVLAEFKDSVERNWRGVQSQAETQTALVSAIFGKAADDANGGIQSYAARLADQMREQDRLTAKYDEQLATAAGTARDLVAASEKAVREMGPARGSKGPAALGAAAVDVSAARFTQAYVGFSAGTGKLLEATLTGSRARTVQSLSTAAKLTGQKLPEGLDTGETQEQLASVVSEGSELLKTSSETFATVADGIGSTDTKQSAMVGQMYALNATGLLAGIGGDAAAAKAATDESQALRGKLQEAGVTLPGMRPATPAGGAEK